MTDFDAIVAEEAGMQWQPVDSSQIEAIGYESGAEYPLGIKFPPNKKQKAAGEPGSEYHYKNVSPELHAEFLAAESIGSFFGTRIKSRPDLYPYVKVEAENPPQPPSSPNGGGISHATFHTTTSTGTVDSGARFTTTTSPKTNVDSTKTPPDSTTTAGETTDPGTALTVIDAMADDLLFTPNAVTDAQLAAGRDWYLAEAKKYDISTEKARMDLKRFARPLQKLRTGIEARAKELTGATKRKIAAIDAEKRRLVQIVGGIEDEVLAPLTAWEQEEEQRKTRLANIANELAAKGQRIYASVAEIEMVIGQLESFDLSAMQEYKVGAESAIAASLKVLKPELERRKVAEANEAELAKLRAEAAARAEQDRLDAAAKAARELAEAEASERERQKAIDVEIERQRLESEKAAAEERARQAEAKAKADAESAVEAERKRAADEADRKRREEETRAADKVHRDQVNYAAAYALVSECLIDEPAAHEVIRAIAKGLIPNVRIEY